MRQLILERSPRWRRGLLLALIIAMPLLFWRPAMDAFNIPKLTLLLSIVALVAGLEVIERLQGVPPDTWRHLLIPAVAIALPLAIAWIASPYKTWSLFGDYSRLQGLIPYLAVIAAGFLIANAFRGRVSSIAWGLVIAGAGVGFYAVVQLLGLDPFEWTTELQREALDASSTLGNANFTGGFLAIVLPVAVVLWLTERDRRAVASILGVIVLAGLIASNSQGAWAAGIAGAAVTAGLFLARRWRWAHFAGFAIALTIAIAAVAQVLLGIVEPRHPFVPNSVRLRSEAWVGAARMSRDNPLLGRGPNSFAIEGPRYRTRVDAVRIGFSYPDDPHSVPLSLLSGAGVLGGLGYLVLAGWTALRARAARTTTDLWAAGFLGAAGSYFVQSLVSIDEPTLRFALWTCLAGLVITTQAAASSASSETAPSKSRRKRAARAPLKAPIAVGGALLIAALAVAAVGRLLLADIEAQRGTVLAAQGLGGDARLAFERALSLGPDHFYAYPYGSRIGALAVEAQDAEALGDTLPVLERAAKVPDPSVIAGYGRFLHTAAKLDPALHERALDAYARARSYDPLNPLIMIYEADLLIELGRADDALAALDPWLEAMDRPAARGVRTYDDFWGAVALARYNIDDRAGALAAAQRALAINDEEPRALLVTSALEEEE